MTLVDPTSGAGYAFGEVLPSADMTVIANNQPDALDGAGGGAYTNSAQISLNGYDLDPPARSGYTIGRDEFEVTVTASSTELIWSLVTSASDQEVLIEAHVTVRDGTSDSATFVIKNGYKVRSGTLNNIGSEILDIWRDDAVWDVSLTSSVLTIELTGTADASNGTTFTGDVFYRIRT